MRRNDSSPASSARCNSCQTRDEASESAPPRRSGARVGVIGIAGQLFFAAQTRQPIDEENAVDVERLVEADQARLVARRIGRLDAEKAGQVDDAVQMTAQVGDAEEPAVAVRHRQHRREGENLARFAQRKEAARAALDGQPELGERLGAGGLKPFGEPALEIAKGLFVRHSRRRSPGRPKGGEHPPGGQRTQ